MGRCSTLDQRHHAERLLTRFVYDEREPRRGAPVESGSLEALGNTSTSAAHARVERPKTLRRGRRIDRAAGGRDGGRIPRFAAAFLGSTRTSAVKSAPGARLKSVVPTEYEMRSRRRPVKQSLF
ncbi:MAG: hypothetical protein BJ554DRAFT_4911 [Olpidium bornovanus]|uniref:Uncharacterized protein n=1 Tax=Olpidium bornovanus TaxID=278681 RepID=A0A8H7ZM58_9FUNG|nr:MAG: hypothetical protein BJ554DRAFT_4911 [Olpidium bornovanus]